MSQLMRLWNLSHRWSALLLFAHMKYGSRQRVRPKIRHLAPLDGCACAFEKWDYGRNLMRWPKHLIISYTGTVMYKISIYWPWQEVPQSHITAYQWDWEEEKIDIWEKHNKKSTSLSRLSHSRARLSQWFIRPDNGLEIVSGTNLLLESLGRLPFQRVLGDFMSIFFCFRGLYSNFRHLIKEVRKNHFIEPD